MAANGQLDLSIQIVTPENIAFQYRVAGPLLRLPAYLIDLVIRWTAGMLGIAAMGLVFGAAGFDAVGVGGALVLMFVLTWFYGGLFEALWNGQTPGKRLLGLRVLTVDGQPINALQAILRNVLKTIDSQPGIFYLVGLIAATTNDRFQRLGDLACGTMVVVEQRRWLLDLPRTRDAEVLRLAAALPPYQVSRTLGRALAAYVERRGNFSLQRRREIARHLSEPLRVGLGLASDVSPDLLLCALYHRTFTAEPGEARGAARSGSPFLQAVGAAD